MSRFRRQCQLLAIGTLPTAPGPSTRFGRVKEVFAWWEDGHGLWFIVDEDHETGGNLVEEWSRIMFDDELEDVVDTSESVPTNTERRAEMSPELAETVYGDLCELLCRVCLCLKVHR